MGVASSSTFDLEEVNELSRLDIMMSIKFINGSEVTNCNFK